MDKYEFLQKCSECGGLTGKMQIDCDKEFAQTYNRLIENGEITYFHGFICLVGNKLHDNTYALIPYTGTYQELQEDSAFTEYHYWRAAAKRNTCHKCGKIFFASTEADTCPYCKEESAT